MKARESTKGIKIYTSRYIVFGKRSSVKERFYLQIIYFL